jgi:hypothetical protein
MALCKPIPFDKLLVSHGGEILRHVPKIEDVNDWVNTISYIDHINVGLRRSPKYDGIREYWLWLERAARSPSLSPHTIVAAKKQALLRKRSDGIHYLAVQKVLDRYLNFHPEDYACPAHEQEKIQLLQERMWRQATTQLEKVRQRALQLPMIKIKDALLTQYFFGAR